MLPCLHRGSLTTWWSTTILRGRVILGGLALRCFQRLSFPKHSYPALPLTPRSGTPVARQTRSSVLRSEPPTLPAPTADKDRTVSRRSEPSSRHTLTGEQLGPLGPSPAPGCDEPTSRCQTESSIRSSWTRSSVIPKYLCPLSDGNSNIQPPGGWTCFRTCSTCMSHS